jgi:hypothetical protein
MDGVKVTTFSWGKGLKVTLPKIGTTEAKTYEINLEDPTLASTQLGDVIDAILAKSVQKAEVLMEQEEKDQYAKTYGSSKRDEKSKKDKGGGVPRKGQKNNEEEEEEEE